MGKRGLRSIGIRKVTPNQIDFARPISGSITFHQAATPESVDTGLGSLYIKSDGKLYFKSFMFEETDLTSGGGGGGASNGLSFSLTTNTLSIESDATYGDTDADGGDWGDFANGPSTKADASVAGASAYTATGYDSSHPSNGGNPATSQYMIDGSNASATTDKGQLLQASLTGHNDDGPTDFTIDFKNADSGNKVLMKLRVTLDSNQTKLQLSNLTQYQDNSSTTFSSITVNIPFKVNVGGSIVTVTRTLTVQKIRTGLEGNSARVINISPNKLAFTYLDSGATHDAIGSSTLTATALNTAAGATLYYEWFNITTGQQVAAPSSAAGANEFTYTPPNNVSAMPQVIEVRVRETSGNDAGTILARDQVSMIGLLPGSGAYQVVLANPAHVVPVDGGTITFTNSSPKAISVYKGASRLEFITSGTPGDGEYTVSVTPTDVTVSTANPTVAGNPPPVPGGTGFDAVFGDHTAMSQNLGLVAYTANCENKQSVTAIQTVTKSLQGIQGETGPGGDDGKTVKVIANKMAIAFDQEGNTPSPASISLTTAIEGIQGSPYYEWQIDDVQVQNTTTSTYTFSKASLAGVSNGDKGLSGSGAPSSLLFQHFPIKVEVIVRASSDTSTAPLARDQLTIVGLKPGKNGYTVVVRNEAHTVPETNTGTITYTGSGTTVQVYKGVDELTAVAPGVTPSLGQYTVSDVSVGVGNLQTIGSVSVNTSANPDNIIIADHSGTMSDNVVLTITIKVESNSTTVIKTQSLAKSKQGADGSVATGVDIEIDPPVIVYDTQGANPDVSSIDLIATTRNLGTEIVRSAKFGHSATTYAALGGTGINMSATNVFTIAFWIKLADDFDPTASSTNRYIFNQGKLRCYYTNGNLKLYHTTINGGSETGRVITQSNFFTAADAGKWVHVLIGRYSDGDVFFSKNGKNQSGASGIQTGATADNTVAITTGLAVGNYTSNNSLFVQGELSNLLIYNSYLALGNGDVEKHYNSGKVHTNYLDNSMPGYNKIIVWYKLDEDQGSTSDAGVTFQDSSGRGKHLTDVAAGVESISSPGLFSKAGPSYFTFKVAGTVVGSANQTFPYVSYTSIPSTYTSFKSDPKTATVELRADSTTETVGGRDQGSIVALKAGTNAVETVMNNPTHFFDVHPADHGSTPGAVISYAASGTTIKVYSGGTLMQISADGAGTDKFRVKSVTVNPAGILTPAPVNTMTQTNGQTTVTVPDHTAGGTPFNVTRTTGEVIYTITVEGTDKDFIQKFATNRPGNTGADSTVPGPSGADVGIQIEMLKPLCVVRTDPFGVPLSGQLANTGTEIKVTKNGETLEFHHAGGVNPGSPSPSANTWTAVVDTGIQSSSGWSQPGTPYTVTNAVGSTDDHIDWEPLSTLTVGGIYRTLKIVVNIGGVLYYPRATQQVVKVVGEVGQLSIEYLNENNLINIVRDQWQTYYWPRHDGSTILGTSFVPALLGPTSYSASGLRYHATDNDRWSIDIHAEPGNTTPAYAYQSNIVIPGTLSLITDQHGTELFDQTTLGGSGGHIPIVGLRYGKLNTLDDVLGRTMATVTYKDGEGTEHRRPLSRRYRITVKEPPIEQMRVRFLVDFTDTTSDNRWEALKNSETGPGGGHYRDAALIPVLPNYTSLDNYYRPRELGYRQLPLYANPAYSPSATDGATNQRSEANRFATHYPFTSATQAEQAMILNHDEDIRFTGDAFGQLSFRDLAFSNANRSIRMSVHMFRITGDSGNTGNSRAAIYVGTVGWSVDSSGTIYHGLATSISAGYRAVELALKDRTVSTAWNSTDIMKVPKNNAVICSIHFAKDDWVDVIPNAGRCYCDILLPYYRLGNQY